MNARIRERLVRQAVAEAYNMVTGGHENALTDYGTPMPARADMEDEAYYEVLKTPAVEMAGQRIAVKKDIRFLGEARIRELIAERFAKGDGN